MSNQRIVPRLESIPTQQLPTELQVLGYYFKETTVPRKPPKKLHL